MLSTIINEGEIGMLGICGTTQEILADVFCLTREIYKQIKKESEEEASKFKKVFTEHTDLVFMSTKELGKELDKVKEKFDKKDDELESKLEALDKAIKRVDNVESEKDIVSILEDLLEEFKK